jgi:membrane protein implicated in regulation of membrane protease activity
VAQIGAWAWWVGGLLLLGMEVLLPGTFFLWFGVAAIITGTIALIFDLVWQVQVVIFIVLAAILVLGGRRYFARRRTLQPESGLNDRSATLVGNVYVLHQPIVDGVGRIRVGDSNWRVSGPDLPSGTRVRVVAADGASLRVEALAP